MSDQMDWTSNNPADEPQPDTPSSDEDISNTLIVEMTAIIVCTILGHFSSKSLFTDDSSPHTSTSEAIVPIAIDQASKQLNLQPMQLQHALIKKIRDTAPPEDVCSIDAWFLEKAAKVLEVAVFSKLEMMGVGREAVKRMLEGQFEKFYGSDTPVAVAVKASGQNVVAHFGASGEICKKTQVVRFIYGKGLNFLDILTDHYLKKRVLYGKSTKVLKLKYTPPVKGTELWEKLSQFGGSGT
ncbi:hypothetical protein BDV95DRAFT_608271 [Massariosphaeria phaeospora]|uniref:Uncharacterized protein n=1 Tax=Massariosphaeria phaeospora TaxID=100035 RepID=A0A7C8I7Q6_9PLEO|nr:hypothetical protein BDV95DRAFT_608271 [Massariosphaeria phaeospora]